MIVAHNSEISGLFYTEYSHNQNLLSKTESFQKNRLQAVLQDGLEFLRWLPLTP